MSSISLTRLLVSIFLYRAPVRLFLFSTCSKKMASRSSYGTFCRRVMLARMPPVWTALMALILNARACPLKMRPLPLGCRM